MINLIILIETDPGLAYDEFYKLGSAEQLSILAALTRELQWNPDNTSLKAFLENITTNN